MSYGEGYMWILGIIITLGVFLPHPAGWVAVGVIGGLALFG